MARGFAAAAVKPTSAVKRFVIERLEARVIEAGCPPVLNLEVEFVSFLVTLGFDPLLAAELAEEQRMFVSRKVADLIERWNVQGVRAPLAFLEGRDDVVLSWRHQRFSEETGSDPPDEGTMEVYRWLEAQRDRDFLLPCACFLKILGCDPIYVTDGARDEGIDCIGLIASGALRSTAVFIQAKSTSELMAGEPLLQEYGRYAALHRSPRYMQYLEALGVPRLHDGAGYLHAVLLNSDFHFSARQHAVKLGVLLRSRRQLAHSLAEAFPLAALEALKGRLLIPQNADLTSNIAPSLSL